MHSVARNSGNCQVLLICPPTPQAPCQPGKQLKPCISGPAAAGGATAAAAAAARLGDLPQPPQQHRCQEPSVTACSFHTSAWLLKVMRRLTSRAPAGRQCLVSTCQQCNDCTAAVLGFSWPISVQLLTQGCKHGLMDHTCTMVVFVAGVRALLGSTGRCLAGLHSTAFVKSVRPGMVKSCLKQTNMAY